MLQIAPPLSATYPQPASLLSLFQLTNPYMSFTKNMTKFTTTGIYAGFSKDARTHKTTSTTSFAAYPTAKRHDLSMVSAAARKLVTMDIVLNTIFGVSSIMSI